MAKNLYMAVDNTPYELALFVADSVVEMAGKFNTTPSNISCKISRGHIGKSTGVTFLRVEVEE